MKHLLFFFLTLSLAHGLTGQTADYSYSEGNYAYTVPSQTLFFDLGADTLSGTDDTLMITFPRSFTAFYNISYTGVLAASSTSTTTKAELLVRNTDDEQWILLDDVALDTEGPTISMDADLSKLQMALRYVSATGSAHVKTALVLKKKSSSAAASGGASYLVYTALLTQSGTNAPVATVLENTLGGTVEWWYSGVGEYTATLVGAFPVDKVTVTFFISTGGGNYYASWERDSDDLLYVYTESGGPKNDVFGAGSSIEIRVYP